MVGHESDAEEVAMHPAIAEQLAAMRRRDLQEDAMMPYDTYRLYQIERPRTAAEIRCADEHTGRLSAAIAGLARRLTLTGPTLGRARRRRIARVPRQPSPGDGRMIREPALSRDSDRANERVGVR
jgi:hypothetical protein